MTRTRDPDEPWMTAADLYAARATLGLLWGFGRPLAPEELAQAIRLSGKDPGKSIREYETRTRISGPMSALVTLYLRGTLPPDGIPPRHVRQRRKEAPQ